jgi:hypothetical protein
MLQELEHLLLLSSFFLANGLDEKVKRKLNSIIIILMMKLVADKPNRRSHHPGLNHFLTGGPIYLTSLGVSLFLFHFSPPHTRLERLEGAGGAHLLPPPALLLGLAWINNHVASPPRRMPSRPHPRLSSSLTSNSSSRVPPPLCRRPPPPNPQSFAGLPQF